MNQKDFWQQLIDESNNPIWIIDVDFKLVYRNQSYKQFVEKVVLKSDDLTQSNFSEGEPDLLSEKLFNQYKKAFDGNYFEHEHCFDHLLNGNSIFIGITYKPLFDENQKVLSVVCESKDITNIVSKRQEANELMNASLDVFCTIDEDGLFKYVSAASKDHWGYLPEELIGAPYINLILEEDIPKTNQIAESIIGGRDIRTFINRYRKKDGGVAYNLWSARWDNKTKIMYCIARNAAESIEQDELVQQSEQRFKALVQDGSDLIGILDAEGKYIYVSPTSTSIFGIPPENFLGKSAFDFIHPDDIEKTLSSLQKISVEKKVFVEPFRFKNHKNEWRWVETVLTNMMDIPSVGGIVANSRDITESINSRKKIEESELFNRSVLESSPDCLKVLDTNGRIQFMNFNGLCQMEIDDFETVKNKNWWVLWGSENQELVKSSLQKALNGESAEFEAFCPTYKGTPKWWHVMLSPVSKPGDSLQQIISVSRDITTKKQEEQKLKLLESVVTNTNDAILITEAEPFDEPGPKIIYVNEAFTKMTGYSAEEVIGKSPRILQGENSSKEELARLSRALRNWESCEITTLNYRKNGEEFWINFSVSPVADETGWYTHWIAIERDVTEYKIKELEKELFAEISLDFTDEKDYIKATIALCKTVSNFGNFDLVELWTPDIEKSQIQLISYFTSNVEAEKLYKGKKRIKSFQKSEGLPGKIWDINSRQILNEADILSGFHRTELANEIGLKTIIGIPLNYSDEVVGVLLIGSKLLENQLVNYNSIFQELEIFIGSELNRKRLERDLSHLFDAIPDVVSMGDFKGRFLKMNKAGCELLGYNEEEILSRNFIEFMHPEDLDQAFIELKNLESGETLLGFECRFITKDNNIIWLSWYCRPELNEGVIYSTAKNITKEKNLTLLNHQVGKLAKIGSWELDVVNNKLYWSDMVHEIHETDPKTHIPKLDESIKYYKEDYQELVNISVNNCIESGNEATFEAVIVTAKKNERWVRAQCKAEIIDGKCISIFGSFQDITETKDAENRLHSLANNLPGVVFQYVVSPDGTDQLRFVTEGSIDIWGFTPEEVIQNNSLVWDQIKAGGEYESVKNSIGVSIETRENWSTQWKYLSPNGEMKVHKGYGSPSYLSDGTIIFNSVILDISNEVSIEELLKQVTQQAKIGSWVVDFIDGDHYLSGMACEIIGMKKNDRSLDLKLMLNFLREDFRELAEMKFVECYKLGHPFDFEGVIVTTDLKEKWVRIIGSAEIQNEKCRRIFGSMQDIHTQKDTENRLTTISENLPGVVYRYMIYPDGTDELKYVSKGAHKLWGISAEEAMKDVSLVWDRIKLGGNYDEIQQSISYSILNKTKWSSRIKYVMPSGELRTHLGYGTPNILVDGSIVFDSMVLDITQDVKNEELLLQASQMTRIGSWEIDLLDPAGMVMYMSPMIKEILDVSENYKPMLTDCIDFFIGDSNIKIKSVIANLIENGEEFDEELLLRNVKHNEIWVRCIGKSEVVDNKRTKIYGSFQDIHVSKSLELRISEILESISDAFYALDKNWNFNYFNKEAEQLFEKEHSEVINQNVWEVFPTIKETNVEKIYREVANKLVPQYFEHMYSKNGTWLEVSVYPSAGGVSVYFKDISLRKKYDNDLRIANERYEKVTVATNDAIWDWDILNKTYYRSNAIERFFGKNSSTVLTEQEFWQDKFHPDDLINMQESLNNAITDSSCYRWELEYRILQEDDSVLYVLDRGVISRDSDGNAIRMVGAMTDITEQIRMTLELKELNLSLEEYSTELKRSNSELEQFAFIASHDLQEPLRMVSSFMEQLKRKYEDKLDDKALRYIHFATDGAKRMKHIILDLLEYSRAGKLNEELVTFNLSLILEDYKVLRRRIIEEKKVKISYKNLPDIRNYKTPIIQAMHSIIDNAIKYSKPDVDPKIEIKANEKDDMWIISIKDNGIGINEEFFDKIFVIFQRLHNKDEFKGTGIGLSIAKKNIEACGGRIWIESGVGKGSTFYFSLNKNTL